MDDPYFAKAFDQSPVGMAFLGGAGTVISANPALVALLGKPLWSVVGAPFDVHLAPGASDRWAEFFRRVRAGQPPDATFESTYLPADGREAWWSLHLSDLGLEWSGEPTFFVVVQDVTTQRQAERQLREASQAAEDANRAKSEFLANMSHEIRTPLFTITGMTDLLRMGDLKGDQAHHAGQIASAADHLLGLVNDVLDFSKIEAGQMTLEAIPFDLEDLVGQCLEVVGLTAYRKGIELVLDVDPQVPRSWIGDPSRLRQILVNLLGNAVKFTPRGRVILAVDPGPTFRVRDTGIGIAPEARPGLFQVFTQADSSTTRQFGGSGLGLAITQRLVSLMGGTIGLTSEVGVGTEFVVTLGLQPAGGPEPAPLAPGAGFRVVVVDDDPGVRSLLVRRLGQAGFAVEAAAGPAEVGALLEGTRPDVVLIDQELGPDDGWQLASDLRADPRAAGVPLVLMSLLRKSLAPSPRYPADLFRWRIDKPVAVRALAEGLVRGLTRGWETLAPQGPEPEAGPDRRPRASGLTVLVAEDHEVNRELFRLLLRSLGHRVISVDDGQEACEAAPSLVPDLIFMDLQMPRLNGYEAAAELRRLGVRCPIVAVTASALKGEWDRCRAAGMNALLTKPFTLETLDAAVRTQVAAPAPSADEGEVDLLEGDEGTAPGAEEPFHRSEALAVLLGNEALLGRLLVKFVDHGRDILGRIADARQKGDTTALKSAAHALKGSAANLTARPLSRAAEALEAAAAEGRWAEVEGLAEAVDRAWEAFETFVS